jgi:uncharacterized membrane protein HdeD (DUF308 family)
MKEQKIMTSTAPLASPQPRLGSELRRLYFARFAFAVVWAIVLIVSTTTINPLLTVLLVLYPLVDAAAVFWQLRSEGRAQASRVPEWFNVVLSVVAAIALGWAATVSLSAALAVWGAWAIVSGIVQLLAAILRRKTGGQVPLIISGAISIFAGSSFLVMSAHTTSVVGIGGYAILGAIFFLIAAIRLTVLLRRK